MVASSHRIILERRKGRREGRQRRSHKEELGPRGHYPSSLETKAALLDFFFTEGLLCTAWQ
jgi:hypothetical protein